MTEVTRARANGPEDILSIVPLLLGFEPKDGDIVLLGVQDTGRVGMTMRFDAKDVGHSQAANLTATLRHNDCTSAIAIGYGSGQQVTPAVDTLLPALAAGVEVRDALRVEGNRFFSYTCKEPECCPVDGREFQRDTEASTALRVAGLSAERSRDDVAARVAAPTSEASLLAWDERPALTIPEARDTVLGALQAAEDGRQLDDSEVARLAASVQSIPVRDLAWSAMVPDKADAHLALWSDVVRRTPDAGVAAPGSLMAVCAWQKGDGALANVALDRVEQASPGYTMGQLIGQALAAGLPPSVAVPPMSPADVMEQYPVLQDPEPDFDQPEMEI